MKFTRASIAQLSIPASGEVFHWDSDLPGFGVRLRGRAKRWVIQYRFRGHQRRESLGDVRKVTLEAARDIARKRFAQVELGTDPAAEREKAKVAARAAKMTLAVVAQQYMDSKARRPGTQRALVRYFTKAWLPMRDVPIGDIDRAAVAKRIGVLAKASGGPAASRARSALSSMFAWAIREGLADSNPVSGTNDPGIGAARTRVLKDAELRLIWRSAGDGDFGRIIKLLMLTACRREEIGGLQWSEIADGILTLPGSRTKNHREHVLPLPPLALELLPPPRAERPWLFGGRGPGFCSWHYEKLKLDNRIAAASGKPVAGWVLHDIRRSAATGMADIGVQPHIIEAVLNHYSGHKAGVAGIYNRATYDKEKREALAAWAKHVAAIVS